MLLALFLFLILLPILLPIFLLLLGLVVGSWTERDHLDDLARREAAVADVLVTDLKGFPAAVRGGPVPTLLCGEVTLASDRMKDWIARWKRLFGGEIRGYEALLRRARREACLRVREAAKAGGYNAVCNLRLDGVDIAGAATAGMQARKGTMVTVLASGTAYTWGQAS